MPLPSSQQKPHGWWKLRRQREAEDDAECFEESGVDQLSSGSEEFEEASGQLVFCPCCKIGNILAPREDAALKDCVICAEPLVSKQKDKPDQSVISSLFEPLLGARQRHRERLGFRRVHSLFELEMDHNTDLKGDRLRQAMQDWLEEENTSWDRIRRRPRNLWDDRPWFLFILIGLAVVVGSLSIFLVISLRDTAVESVPIRVSDVDARERLRDALPEELSKAEPVARAFFKAEFVTDLLPLIRQRNRVESLMLDYYQGRLFEPVDPEEIEVIDAVDFVGRKFLRLAVRLPNSDVYGLTLERTDRDYLVDWESFVGYSAVDWKDFRGGAPAAGETVELRAHASFTEQYLAPFEDATLYQSIILRSIDGDSLVGYIDRSDDACLRLREKAAEAGKNHYEVIVRVRYPEENWTVNEVEIVEIVQTGWVVWDRLPVSAQR